MTNSAVVRVGGKQYLVHEGQEFFVQKLDEKENETVELEALMKANDAKVEIGEPALKTNIKAKVLEHVKGDKIHVSKFKSKVRYRKKIGFRPELTKLKIISL